MRKSEINIEEVIRLTKECKTPEEIGPLMGVTGGVIRNRLKEVYGETLPRELDEQIPYIIGEIYNATRNHCAQAWNVEPEKGW